MSHEANAPAQERTLSRVMRFFLIVALFVLIGPLIGGIVVWLMLFAIGYARGTLGGGGDWTEALRLTFGVSYPIGAPLAAISGIVHAVLAIWFNKRSVMVPLIAAVISVVPMGLIGGPPMSFNASIMNALLFFPPALVASLACWGTTRSLLRA